MRVYLDTNIYQDLKKEEFIAFLSSVRSDKVKNIYFFSEAHIYDLVRDKTDEKISDMKFMEQICGNNCYFFDKTIQYNFFTPIQYYERFDWTPCAVQMDSDPLQPLVDAMKTVPLSFRDYIKPEQLSVDCPKDLIQLLDQPTNLYEFACSFINFSENLTNDQVKFKELLKYLHINSIAAELYAAIGISGFDGNKIVNKLAFKDSYLNYCYKGNTQKDMYSVFMAMYNNLELLGLVKGKPRKQKMMNLVNDARHAYFGSFCDVVVSKDEDFINKASFLYSSLGLENLVCKPEQFLTLISNRDLHRESLEELVSAINEMPNGEIKEITRNENETSYQQSLIHLYYSYFDTITFNTGGSINKYFFSKERISFSLKAVQPEVEYLTNKMVAELGPDLNNNTLFDVVEIKEDGWCGRHWIVNGMLIELFLHEKLFIRISILSK